MTETYLVEIIYKTERGGGRLVRHLVEAGSTGNAIKMVRNLYPYPISQEMAGYVTADPYKVDNAQSLTKY